jgi:hypothetical protein
VHCNASSLLQELGLLLQQQPLHWQLGFPWVQELLLAGGELLQMPLLLRLQGPQWQAVRQCCLLQG